MKQSKSKNKLSEQNQVDIILKNYLKYIKRLLQRKLNFFELNKLTIKLNIKTLK